VRLPLEARVTRKTNLRGEAALRRAEGFIPSELRGLDTPSRQNAQLGKSFA
jgi:hypothetical protein